MSFTDIDSIGKLFQTDDRTIVEWQISNFSKLSDELDTCFFSPGFAFSDQYCRLCIFPNGDSNNKTIGQIMVYVGLETHHTCPIDVDLCLKYVNGDEECGKRVIDGFQGYIRCVGDKFLSRSKLDAELLPRDVLTIECEMKCPNYHPIRVSLVQRLQNLSLTMKKILAEGTRSDIVLKVNDQQIRAHKVTLEARSDTFAGMLRDDTAKKGIGEVAIAGVEADVFKQLLNYMYSGKVGNIRHNNVFKLYVAADKYLLQEVKELCTEFMEEQMSDDLFCDVLAIADTHKDYELMKLVKDYFIKNSVSILNSEKWENFMSRSHGIAAKFLALTWKEQASFLQDDGQ